MPPLGLRLAVVGLMLGSVAVAHVRPPARATSPAREAGRCSEDSWTGGTTEWCDGALVYRDYVYDDTGADSGSRSPHGTGLNGARGDVDHRDHGQSLNSADLLVLRIARRGDGLLVRFELNTLFPGDRTIGAVAIDTDGDRSTGGGRWGDALPVDVAVESDGWDVVHLVHERDHVSNVIEGLVPIPRQASGTWRLQAVTALGDGTPMNVAFRPDETGSWWEARQAAALAEGRVDAFAAEVDAAGLLSGTRHDPAGAPGPGLHERVYRGDLAIAEGVDYEGVPGRAAGDSFGQAYHYLGHHQPYAVYVPAAPGTAGRYGVQLAMHGYGGAHASLVSSPGMQRTMGDALHRLVVVPLGRGPEGFYSDWSERDVLDVLDDVERTWPVDLDRVFTGGYSMGGYGAMRFAALYPDRFAGAISWVGYTGDCMNGTRFAGGCRAGAVGNVFEYLDNTRHVPMAMLYAAGDELVHAHTALALQQRYAELGYRHVIWQHAAEHLTFAILDDWEKEAAWTADLARVRRPARVTYRANAWTWRPDLGIVHDGAYWVDGMRLPAEPRDRTGDMVVDLVSHACEPRGHTVGLQHGAGLDPVPWASQEGVPSGLVEVERGMRISGSASNVGELTVLVDEACIGSAAVRLDIDVDGPTTIRFSDGRPAVTLAAG